MLEAIDLNLGLENLPKLTSIPSFDNVASNSQVIIENTGLTSITGFNSLTNVFYLKISDNPSLTEISGFGRVEKRASGEVIISGNTQFDCSSEPQASLSFLPVQESLGNAVNCPTFP